MSIPDQRRRRIVGDEGKRVEGNYILWGILGSEIWGWMPFLSPTSAKDIHWNSSFLQPPTDSRGKGRFYAPFYVCSQTSEPTPICVQMLFLYFCTGWTSLFTVLYLCRNAVIEFHPSTRAFNSSTQPQWKILAMPVRCSCWLEQKPALIDDVLLFSLFNCWIYTKNAGHLFDVYWCKHAC